MAAIAVSVAFPYIELSAARFIGLQVRPRRDRTVPPGGGGKATKDGRYTRRTAIQEIKVFFS
jgi:hypothetical protein